MPPCPGLLVPDGRLLGRAPVGRKHRPTPGWPRGTTQTRGVPAWPHLRDARTASHHCRSNLPEVGLEGDLEIHEEVEASADFEPDDEEGLRFLRVLGDRYRRVPGPQAHRGVPHRGRYRREPGRLR